MLTDLAHRPPPRLPLLACITLVYFLAGKLGLSFAALNASASAIWPPTGIALAAVLLYGPRTWPAIFLGAFLVNVTTTGSVFSSLAIASGNTLEGLVGAWLVIRTARGAACFQQARDVFRFAIFAAGLATTISASIGTASLVLAGEADAGAAAGIWLTWWLGDAAGALVFAPPLVLWHRNRAIVPDDRLGETVLALALVMGVGVLCFATPWLSAYPVAFLCLPPLAWVAYRFGPRAVSSHILLLAMMAVYTTEHGVGPFVMASRNESLLVLQSFMATLSLTMLPIAALAADHARTSAAFESANLHERRARAEAEAASRAKDDFLTALTHELRNPLQAIASSLWLLDRQVAPGGEARALEIVRRQTGQITRVVSELLDMAKLAASRSALAAQGQPATLAPRRGAAPPPSNGANVARVAQFGTAVPRRVLIVEDNADVRLAVRTLLEHDGHVVFEAEDGIGGIDAATQVRPEVVLIDIGLPGMDGYEVARKLRARFATLRLVALTGYGQPEDRRKGRGAGFDEHLVKPVDPAALQRALGERREQPATA